MHLIVVALATLLAAGMSQDYPLTLTDVEGPETVVEKCDDVDESTLEPVNTKPFIPTGQ